MSNRSERITPALLRGWGLPDPGDSKKDRGRVMVVGGSRRTAGAVVLAGEAALRVGAGRLGVVVPASVDAQLGPVLPEAAVFALPDDPGDPLPEAVQKEIEGVDALLFGPGFDDPEETRQTLLAVAAHLSACLVLDAYGVTAMTEVPRERLPRDVVVNVNREEAALLLDRPPGEDPGSQLRDIADRWDVVVHCYGLVVEPGGRSWTVDAGGPGLGTSGSGDVLAGAIAGFSARGLPPARAAVWGSWIHGTAGDRLTKRSGIGFLARDLPTELTATLRDVLAER